MNALHMHQYFRMRTEAKPLGEFGRDIQVHLKFGFVLVWRAPALIFHASTSWKAPNVPGGDANSRNPLKAAVFRSDPGSLDPVNAIGSLINFPGIRMTYEVGRR